MSRTRPTGGEPVRSIVEAVADFSGGEVTALSPLGSGVDPEAIACIMVSPEADPELTFTYEGVRVTVTPEYVDVEPVDSGGSR